VGRIAVFGSSEFPSPNVVRRFVSELSDGDVVVASGMRGVNKVALAAARARGLEVEEPLKGSLHSLARAAAQKRDSAIINYVDRVVLFWDGTDRINKLIGLAISLGRVVQIFGPKQSWR